MEHAHDSSPSPARRTPPAPVSRWKRALDRLRAPGIERATAYLALVGVAVPLLLVGVGGVVALAGALSPHPAAGVFAVVGSLGIAAASPSLARELLRRFVER